MTTDTEPIYEVDDAEYQFPWHEIDEMDAVDEGLAAGCCASIPCRNPEECPR